MSATETHECRSTTYVDPEHLGVGAEVTICEVCGVQMGQSDLR